MVRNCSATNTGGGSDAYGPDGVNRFHVCQLLTPFEQTANFCGMHYLPPFVVHGTLQEGEQMFERAAEQYRACLQGLLDDTLDLSGIEAGDYLTDALLRCGVCVPPSLEWAVYRWALKRSSSPLSAWALG